MSHASAEQKSKQSLHLFAKIKRLSPKINLIGIISYDKMFFLIIEGGINSKVFIDFLSKFMIDDEYIDKISCFDMAKFHTYTKTIYWLTENNIEDIILPPKKADINMIEGLWSILK